jgi:hypothetical protein
VNPRAALAFVSRHGIVLEAAHGSVPTLSDAVAGERVPGAWWGHRAGREIFGATRAVRAHPDVLVCRIAGGKITYVHRRLWPALVRLAPSFPRDRLAAIREIHTPGGAHRVDLTPFPQWVTAAVRAAAAEMNVEDAERALASLIDGRPATKPRRKKK